MLEHEIKQLFPEKKEAESVRLLLADEDTRQLVIKQIERRLLDYHGVLTREPFDQLRDLLSTAEFEHESYEPSVVARMILDYIRHNKEKEIPPYFSDFLLRRRKDGQPNLNELSSAEKKDIGSRCFLGLAFLFNRIKKRFDPNFYREKGVMMLENCGMDDIARNFRKWEYHTRENLAWSCN